MHLKIHLECTHICSNLEYIDVLEFQTQIPTSNIPLPNTQNKVQIHNVKENERCQFRITLI